MQLILLYFKDVRLRQEQIADYLNRLGGLLPWNKYNQKDVQLLDISRLYININVHNEMNYSESIYGLHCILSGWVYLLWTVCQLSRTSLIYGINQKLTLQMLYYKFCLHCYSESVQFEQNIHFREQVKSNAFLKF